MGLSPFTCRTFYAKKFREFWISLFIFRFSFSKRFEHYLNGVFSVNVGKVMIVSKFNASIVETYFSATMHWSGGGGTIISCN